MSVHQIEIAGRSLYLDAGCSARVENICWSQERIQLKLLKEEQSLIFSDLL